MEHKCAHLLLSRGARVQDDLAVLQQRGDKAVLLCGARLVLRQLVLQHLQLGVLGSDLQAQGVA